MHRRLLYRLVFALPFLLLARVPAAADTPAPMSATVIMNDGSFNPAAITVQPGGTVTWINQGQNVHTATALGGAPLPFNTGGIGPGQSQSFTFGLAGTYYYTSATDCQSGNMPAFNCAISFLVNVTSASVVATAAAATAASLPSTPTPIATLLPAGMPPPLATVAITDTGFDPPSVTVALNGSVMFVNNGTVVHTATSPGNTTWQGFDSGGLARGQIFYVGFAQPGSFTYSSAPDCLNGNSTPVFKCGTYTVVVSSIALPQPTAIPTFGPTPLPVIAAPNPNTQIILDDGGFHPNVLTIKAGQSVTWVEKGAQVHTVTSDATYVPAFDSGGMNPNQTFTVTFPNPGSFGYHSQPDVTYFSDAGCGCTAANYLLRGTINVSP